MQQVADHGIPKFMHRLGLGYTNYFNEKYKRSGSLFQGTFKANRIDSDEYLLYVSAYVNLNYKIHKFEDKLFQSSFNEYAQGGEFCDKGIILDQFANISKYQEFAENALMVAQGRKELEKIIKLDLET